MSADERQLILKIKSSIIVCFFIHLSIFNQAGFYFLLKLVTMVISPAADVFLPVTSSFLRIILQSTVGEAKMYPSFN